MAKTNNLNDFLTDIANAIRYKKGTTDKINPQNFSTEIVSIETSEGGPFTPITANDVTFYDYDGRVLYSYTKEEFISLRSMPPIPIRKGLICQEWNYTLEDAQSYVADYGVCNIGATYITDDGKTRLYITIAAEGRMDVPLNFFQTVSNGVTIDWGDGSAPITLSDPGRVKTTHHYESIGDYVISLEVADGCALRFIDNSMMGEFEVYRNMLRKAEVGYGVTVIDYYAFRECHSLSSVVIPNSVTSIGSRAFERCYSLSFIVIPNSISSISSDAFERCYSLSSIVIPNSVTSIDSYAFNECRSLSSIVIPNSVSSISHCVFEYCYSLSSIVIPNSVTNIEYYDLFSYCHSLSSVVMPNSGTIIYGAFRECTSLSSIVIPNSITSIDYYAFQFCSSMAFYDFSSCIAVPTLSGTDNFTHIPYDCKIVVPDALYDEWVAATNWSTYASYIVKASDFNA